MEMDIQKHLKTANDMRRLNFTQTLHLTKKSKFLLQASTDAYKYEITGRSTGEKRREKDLFWQVRGRNPGDADL